MATFLTREQIYRLLQRELPEGVYPDGPASAYFSTADMDASASTMASAYENDRKIYDNSWPQDADEKIADWEIKVFGELAPISLSLEERQDRVLTRLRSRLGITASDMKQVVLTVIGSDKLVEIIEWGCKCGGWMIGISQLGIETFLNAFGPEFLQVTGPNLCSASPSEYGLTEEQWLELREQAYTYEVRIYDYTLTEAERAEINRQLLKEEPAGSHHVITDGLDPDTMLEGDS